MYVEKLSGLIPSPHPQSSFPSLALRSHSQSSFPGLALRPHSQSSFHVLIPSPRSQASSPGLALRPHSQSSFHVLIPRPCTFVTVRICSIRARPRNEAIYFILGMCDLCTSSLLTCPDLFSPWNVWNAVCAIFVNCQ